MPQDDRIAAVWAEVDANIDRVGWHATGVFPTEDDHGAPFVYTVGLMEQGHPELVVIGLDPRTGHSMLNAVICETFGRPSVRDGEPMIHSASHFVLGRMGGVIEGLDVWLLECTAPATWTEYLTMARRRAEAKSVEARRALQIVFPDAGGRFPWEGWTIANEAQPLLGGPPS